VRGTPGDCATAAVAVQTMTSATIDDFTIASGPGPPEGGPYVNVSPGPLKAAPTSM
jgi:hypothetical protein